MVLLDKPGALSKIATIFGDAGISIDRMRQYSHDDAHAPVLFVTHKASSDDLEVVMERFVASGVVVGTPMALRIEDV